MSVIDIETKYCLGTTESNDSTFDQESAQHLGEFSRVVNRVACTDQQRNCLTTVGITMKFISVSFLLCCALSVCWSRGKITRRPVVGNA